jgi:hypothetical protein
MSVNLKKAIKDEVSVKSGLPMINPTDSSRERRERAACWI